MSHDTGAGPAPGAYPQYPQAMGADAAPYGAYQPYMQPNQGYQQQQQPNYGYAQQPGIVPQSYAPQDPHQSGYGHQPQAYGMQQQQQPYNPQQYAGASFMPGPSDQQVWCRSGRRQQLKYKLTPLPSCMLQGPSGEAAAVFMPNISPLNLMTAGGCVSAWE